MKYIAFRLLETVLLLGVVVTVHVTADGYRPELAYPHLGLSYAVSNASETFVINSLFVGFALSLYATLVLHRGGRGLVWGLSLLIALAGFAGHVNEIVRLFSGHPRQVVVDLSLALVFLDWILAVKNRKGQTRKIITPEQRVAAALGEGGEQSS